MIETFTTTREHIIEISAKDIRQFLKDKIPKNAVIEPPSQFHQNYADNVEDAPLVLIRWEESIP